MVTGTVLAGRQAAALKRRTALWRIALCWAAGVAAMIVAALHAVERSEQRLLASDAERTAVQYADYVAQSVPELALLFQKRELTDRAHQALIRSYRLGDVFRLKLFDPRGVQILVSDDLGSASPVPAVAEASSLGGHHGDEQGNGYVRDIVLGGANYIELADGREKPDRPDWYSEAYVPFNGPDGLLGVIEVYVDQTERQQRIATSFREVATIIISLLLVGALAVAWQIRRHLSERRRGEARIRYLAEHDALSGALNRASFERALEAAIRNAQTSDIAFAVHCVDLDGFKEVNDTLGHAAGDQVLREVADRLSRLCGPVDVLARLGGDEFALLQAGIDGPRDIESFGARIIESLTPSVLVDEQRVSCGASVGAACYGVDAKATDELLHKADLAMYRSKHSGRGRFSFYDETLDRELEDRRLLAIDLRSALADKALSLYFQPLFDAAQPASTPSGYEALMRWNHPQRGNVIPAVFIPLAEETGLIESLGTWAIDEACRTAVTWENQARVAVNLSPAQFADGAGDIVDVVSAALERSGLPPGRLEVEITESLLIGDPESVIAKLERLSGMGVQIAMDDFGTGYSSLSYLWRFPFDKVKIDRAFVNGLDTEKKVSVIIGSIVSLAHSLGMRVNAEGVETESQRDALQRLGCDELQGFLLGRPSPVPVTALPDSRRAA